MLYKTIPLKSRIDRTSAEITSFPIDESIIENG